MYKKFWITAFFCVALIGIPSYSAGVICGDVEAEKSLNTLKETSVYRAHPCLEGKELNVTAGEKLRISIPAADEIVNLACEIRQSSSSIAYSLAKQGLELPIKKRSWFVSLKPHDFSRIINLSIMENWVAEGPYPLINQVVAKESVQDEDSVCVVCGVKDGLPPCHRTHCLEATYKLVGSQNEEPVWVSLIQAVTARKSFFEEEVSEGVFRYVNSEIHAYPNSWVGKNGTVTVGGHPAPQLFMVQQKVGPAHHECLFATFID